jgi:hypothetical protein
MGLMLWSFSLYMTLSTWKIWLYILAMAGYIGWTFVYGIIDLGWNLKLGLRIINLGLYALIIVGTFKKYRTLTKAGGLYGITGKDGKNTMDGSSSKIFDKACKGLKKGELWTDNSFPATMESIKGNAIDQSPMANI